MPTYERSPKPDEAYSTQAAATLQVGYDKKHKLWYSSAMDGDQRRPVNRLTAFDDFINDLLQHGYELPPNMISQLIYDKIRPGEIEIQKVDLQGWRPVPDELSTCWTCRQHEDPAYLQDRNCSECRDKYSLVELAAIQKFVEGYVACLDARKPSTAIQMIDEWCAIPSDPSIDIHFMSDEDEEGGTFGHVLVYVYRRDKSKVGDCDDELRVR